MDSRQVTEYSFYGGEDLAGALRAAAVEGRADRLGVSWTESDGLEGWWIDDGTTD